MWGIIESGMREQATERWAKMDAKNHPWLLPIRLVINLSFPLQFFGFNIDNRWPKNTLSPG